MKFSQLEAKWSDPSIVLTDKGYEDEHAKFTGYIAATRRIQELTKSGVTPLPNNPDLKVYEVITAMTGFSPMQAVEAMLLEKSLGSYMASPVDYLDRFIEEWQAMLRILEQHQDIPFEAVKQWGKRVVLMMRNKWALSRKTTVLTALPDRPPQFYHLVRPRLPDALPMTALDDPRGAHFPVDSYAVEIQEWEAGRYRIYCGYCEPLDTLVN